jgi:methylmalonyl-CoA epimerase
VNVHHVGIAVDDLDAAVATYASLFGAAVDHRAVVEDQGVEAASVHVGPSRLELLAPLGPETPVGKFLAKRGPGLHHVAYRVDDVDRTLSALAGAGMRLIDEQARRGIRNSRVAFVHPASTGGVLTEIVQPAPEAH